MENLRLAVSPLAFPIVFKDIDLGAYLIESKYPDGSFNLGHVQVMMDNNVLGIASNDPELFLQKLGWYFGMRSVVSLNPALALVEQCISNSEGNALKHIMRFEEAFAPLGVFPKGYAQTMTRDISKRDADIRQQAGFFFCFVALLRKFYLDASKNDEESLNKWIGVFNLDIPRSAFMYWLGAIFILSKTNSKLRLIRQSSRIETFAKSFVDFRTEENGDYTRWLRNRVFDLLLFMLAPTLSFQELGGISSRTILMSQDKFVGEFIGRLFTWHGEQANGSPFSLMPLMRMIDIKEFEVSKSVDLITQSFPQPRDKPDNQTKKQRMRNLIDHSLSVLTTQEQSFLYKALCDFRIFEHV